MASTRNVKYDSGYGLLAPSCEEAIAQYEQPLSPDERQCQQQQPRPSSMDLQPEDHDHLRQGTEPNTFAQVTNAPVSEPAAGVPSAYSLPPTVLPDHSRSATGQQQPDYVTVLMPAPEHETIMAAHTSMAAFRRTTAGIESEDPILEDPSQLHQFLVTHNDRPNMQVVITGHHSVERRNTTPDKGGQDTITMHTEEVEDFKMVFDVSDVSMVGTMNTLPHPETGRSPTLPELMKEYAQDKNALKEFHMEKHVIWDYEELKKEITLAIRSLGYRYTIEISFPTQNAKVIVRSASPAASFLNNTWTKVFCFLFLVGIIVYPLTLDSAVVV
ncbi:hypothetical protein BG005_007591 [Podila minutissima]|nr:hypothetical protein BG005_007591 [Podila minutissima]